jgi:hypothetical protein
MGTWKMEHGKHGLGGFARIFIGEQQLNQCHQRAIIMEHGVHGLGGFTLYTGFICEYQLNQRYQRAIIMEHGAHGLSGFPRVLSVSIRKISVICVLS